LDVEKIARKFNYESGEYVLDILVGDSYIDNSLKLPIATVEFSFGDKPSSHKDTSSDPYALKPEIQHVFRPEPPRGSAVTANIFVALLVIAFGAFIVGLYFIGANFGNYPRGGIHAIFTLFFFGCIATLFVIIYLYWLNLQLFDALTYLGVVAIPTIFFGNLVLKYNATVRIIATKKKTNLETKKLI